MPSPSGAAKSAMPRMARIKLTPKRRLFAILARVHGKDVGAVRLEDHYLSVVLNRKACFWLSLGEISSAGCFKDGTLYPDGWKVAFTFEELCWTGEIGIGPDGNAFFRAAHVDESGDDTKIVSAPEDNPTAAFKAARTKYYNDAGIPIPKGKEKSINGQLLFGCAYAAVQIVLQAHFRDVRLPDADLDELRKAWLAKVFHKECREKVLADPSISSEENAAESMFPSFPTGQALPITPSLTPASMSDAASYGDIDDSYTPKSSVLGADSIGDISELFDDPALEATRDSSLFDPIVSMDDYLDGLIQPLEQQEDYRSCRATLPLTLRQDGSLSWSVKAEAKSSKERAHVTKKSSYFPRNQSYMNHYPFTAGEICNALLDLEQLQLDSYQPNVKICKQVMQGGIEDVMAVAKSLFPEREESFIRLPCFMDMLGLVEYRIILEAAELLLESEKHYCEVLKQFFAKSSEALQTAHTVYSKKMALPNDVFHDLLIAPFRDRLVHRDSEQNPKRQQQNPFGVVLDECFKFYADTPSSEQLRKEAPQMLTKFIVKVTRVPLSHFLSRHLFDDAQLSR